MKNLRILIVSLALVAMSGSSAMAHVFDMCWRAEDDGTLTVYSGVSWHDPAHSDLTSGKMYLEVPYPYNYKMGWDYDEIVFTLDTDGDGVNDVDGCHSQVARNNCGAGLRFIGYWAKATVPYLPDGNYKMFSGRIGGSGELDSASCFYDRFWQGVPMESCYDPDGDGMCHSPNDPIFGDIIDNCADDYNPDQSNIDGDGSGDACDVCVYDPTDTDADLDGVCDLFFDLCPGTTADEVGVVPSVRLGTNRWMAAENTDGVLAWVTGEIPGGGEGPGRDYGSVGLETSGGCSCAQIVDMLHLGSGHEMFGCSIGAMDNWVDHVEDINEDFEPPVLGGSSTGSDGSGDNVGSGDSGDPAINGFAAGSCSSSGSAANTGAFYFLMLAGLLWVVRRRRSDALS